MGATRRRAHEESSVRHFRSLRSFNSRLWTAGGLVSNAGTWMQRVAQDWLVLTQLTHHDASALGIVMDLQFAPQLLLLQRDRRIPSRSSQELPRC
jgi:hypothetical protein